MSMEFTLNDLQRQRVEDHLALVEQVLRRSIKTNETMDGMGHDDLYQEGCIALCRASVSYREEMGAFPAYARTVIRNYLLDRCREIQSARKNLPLLSLDAFAEMGAPEPVSPFHTEDLISDVSSDALLSHFRNRYHGTARLGIEAMELRVRGYSCADIAKLYTKQLPAIVKLASSSFGITEDESNGVLEHLITGGDFSLYGLANAVTRFSQDVESYDRATKLEEIGYSVMTMSPALFRQMNRTELLAA